MLPEPLGESALLLLLLSKMTMMMSMMTMMMTARLLWLLWWRGCFPGLIIAGCDGFVWRVSSLTGRRAPFNSDYDYFITYLDYIAMHSLFTARRGYWPTVQSELLP